MYEEKLKTNIMQTVGQYTIIRSIEQTYWNNGQKCGEPDTWYDVCLDGGNGDIVYSCEKLKEARKWAKENKNETIKNFKGK